MEAQTPTKSGLLQVEVTPVFTRNQAADTRIVINEGGTRSSKTFSLAQLFLSKLLAEPGIVITICRKTLPALRATAMKDFIGIARAWGVYDERDHNKTENIYRNPKNGSEVEFLSVDEPQKVRGRKRDYLWMNEANEFELEDFRQLILRTTKQVFMDLNPPDEYHWIVEEIIEKRDDVTLIKSNYRDNTFLEQEVVREIELLQQADENYWRIFGLGERGISGTKIYSHWQLVDDLPEDCDEIIWGVDFGFSNPAAIVRIGIKDQAYYWDELMYERGLVNPAIVARADTLREEGLLDDTMSGYGDAAEPDRIQEFKDGVEYEGRDIEGFNLEAADKSVKDGIDHVKAHKFFITKRSLNLIKEVKAYSWKTKDGKPLEGQPVKLNDHLMDAGRYAIYTHHKNGAGGRPRVRLI
jgi:phage terminase large subunit